MRRLDLYRKADDVARVGGRYAAREGATAALRHRPGGPDVPASLVNANDLGACLDLPAPAEVGREVSVGVRAPGWAEAVWRPGRVVWAREGGRVGVAFLCGLTFDQLRDLCRLPVPIAGG